MNTTHTITPQFVYDPFDSQRITHVIFPVEVFEINIKAATDILTKTKHMIEEFNWRNVPPALNETGSIVVSAYEIK